MSTPAQSLFDYEDDFGSVIDGKQLTSNEIYELLPLNPVVIEARDANIIPLIPLNELTFKEQELSLFDNEPVSVNMNTVQNKNPEISSKKVVQPRKIPPPQAPPSFTATQFQEKSRTSQDLMGKTQVNAHISFVY